MAALEPTYPNTLNQSEIALSVDGLLPSGPNLSHWPGNRTPPAWKADLSTGICLNFARATPAERSAFLGDARKVVNDHYDTDGFLSMLTVVRPELALAHQELLLAAAATGDYQAFQTPTAFAIDRIVLGLARQGSPVAAEFAGLTGAEKDLARYLWLLDNAEQVLSPGSEFAPLYAEELATVTAEVAAARGGGVERKFVHAAQLSVVTSTTALHRMTLNTVAGGYRVLHVLQSDDGTRFRYHDRTESWFEVATFCPPPRADLRPLAARLQELESGGAADPGAPQWTADPPTDPVPELYFGIPSAQAYGAVTRDLRPSALTEQQVVAAMAEHLMI